MFRLYPLTDAQKVEILMCQLKELALHELKAWSDDEKKTVDGWRAASMLENDAFALRLQEAMKAVQTLDPREVQQADETLIDWFIYWRNPEWSHSFPAPNVETTTAR